jgi:hypothetical protein
MSPPHIPPTRIDLAALPPLLSTGDPGSFAQFTLKVRDPEILDGLIDAPYFSPDLKHAFRKFRAEILDGVIQPLREDAPDADFWRALSKPHVGRSWLDVPWFWAETYFYRRILEIVRYFQFGAWRERDPFAPQKDAELAPDAAPRRVQSLLAHLPDDGDAQFEFLMHSALWGNRVDLSYNVERTVGRAAHAHAERANLLVDDAPRVREFFDAHPIKQLVYVADNAGTELSLDLALIDLLLTGPTGGSSGVRASGTYRVEKIILHLKPQPYYVSDAMPQDVIRTLTAFDKANETTRALSKRLRAQQGAGRLELRVHWFYPTCLHFFEMPDDLFAQFRAADFVILKGDVNYRRLIGDAHWKPTIAFDYAARYFPAPFVSLRTMKSDPIVGLNAMQVQELERADPQWRVNGRRGVAQARFDASR